MIFRTKCEYQSFSFNYLALHFLISMEFETGLSEEGNKFRLQHPTECETKCTMKLQLFNLLS